VMACMRALHSRLYWDAEATIAAAGYYSPGTATTAVIFVGRRSRVAW